MLITFNFCLLLSIADFLHLVIPGQQHVVNFEDSAEQHFMLDELNYVEVCLSKDFFLLVN